MEQQKQGFASKRRWKPTENQQSYENHSDFLPSTWVSGKSFKSSGRKIYFPLSSGINP
ncbi:MAG: hypothetical protein AVDCRST_MAG96-3231, partial [uncultured Segetibacter sp.]